MTRLTIASVRLALPLATGATLAAEEEPPATGAVGAAGTLADARTWHTATLLPDGRVLVVGRGDADSGEGALASAELWVP